MPIAVLLWQGVDHKEQEALPVWRQVLASLPETLLQTIVVLPADKGELQRTVEKEGVQLIVQQGPTNGRFTPWRLGLQALNMKATAVLLYPVGQAAVKQETLQTMLAAGEAAPEAIILPTFSGRWGWPRLYPRPLVAEIFLGLSWDELVERYPERTKLLPMTDPAVCQIA